VSRQIPLPLGFDPQQGFDEYHAGRNAEAVAHLQTFAGEGQESFIYLWSERGLGKTHLINACCRSAHIAGRQSAYVPLAGLSHVGSELLSGLEHLDLVGIDDIDRVAGDPAWEEAVFALYNALRDSGHQLIVSGNQAPAQLPMALPDLKTRLGWGITLRLLPMDDNDKLQALSLQARARGLELPDPVGRFLLSHHQRDFAKLCQLLEQLDHATLAAQRKLTIPFLKAYLEQIP
jgi:DnaA family protein